MPDIEEPKEVEGIIGNIKNIEPNPQFEQEKFLSFEALVPEDIAKVFSQKEQEKLLSVLQNSLERQKDKLSDNQFEELQNNIKNLINLASRDQLDENYLLELSDKFIKLGFDKLDRLDEYINTKRQQDLAFLIRNSNIQDAINAGEVELAVKLDTGDLENLSRSEKELLEKSSTRESILINNLDMLLKSEKVLETDREKLFELVKSFNENETFEKQLETLREFIENNKEISEDTKQSLTRIGDLLEQQDVEDISDKIENINRQNLLEQNFQQLNERLDNITSNSQVVENLRAARSAGDLGRRTGEMIGDKIGDIFNDNFDLKDIFKKGKGLGGAAAGALGTLGKFALPVAGAGSVFSGVNRLASGQRISSLSDIGNVGDGLINTLNPFNYLFNAAAYGGEKVNQGFEGIFGTSIGSSIYDFLNPSNEEDLASKQEKKKQADAQDALLKAMTGLTEAMEDNTESNEKSSIASILSNPNLSFTEKASAVASSAWESTKNFFGFGSSGSSSSESNPVPTRQVGRRKPSQSETEALMSGELGSLSAFHESGNAGVGTVSSGKNDPGGVSYGRHQLASKTGTVQRYLKQSKFKDEFKGLKAGTPEFNAKWKQLAKEKPKEFAQDQDAFIKRTHYDEAANYAEKLGFDMNDRGIQEMVFSGGVQHGGIKTILKRTSQLKGFNQMSNEEKIRAFYETRKGYLFTDTKLSKGMATSISANRYAQEVEQAVALSKANQTKQANEVQVAQTERTEELSAEQKENEQTIESLKAQGMPEEDLQMVASLSGVNLENSQPTTEGIEPVTSEVDDLSKVEPIKEEKPKVQPASQDKGQTVIQSTTVNTVSDSYGMDVARFNNVI